MKVLKKFVAVAAVFCFFGLGLASCSSSSDEGAKDKASTSPIIVLYTNDMHCNYEANDDSDQNHHMGLTNVAALKKQFLNTTPNVLLVDCGDAIQGDAIGTVSKGKYIVDLMNKAGYDFKIFGNHEFDYTLPQLNKLMEYSNCPYLNCNITYSGTGTNQLENALSHAVVQLGDKKVGFIGIATPESIVTSTPAYFKEDVNGTEKIVYDFKTGETLYAAVQKAVNTARAEGADYVVALGHLGNEASCSPNRAYDVIKHTTGIDVFLDGHEHSFIESENNTDNVKNKDGKYVQYSQTGEKLRNVGCLKIDVDGTITTSYVSTSATDVAFDRFVAMIDGELDAELNKVIAESEITFSNTKPALRSNTGGFCNFIADAFRVIGEADVAIVNGGGIRAGVDIGDVTMKQLIKIQPYNNSLRVVKATGQQIMDALEWGSKVISADAADNGDGGFLHVSGLKYTIDVANPPAKVGDSYPNWNYDSTGKSAVSAQAGLARRVSNVMVWDPTANANAGAYVAIVADKEYKLASHNYLLQNEGDGFGMFKNCAVEVNNSILDNNVIINFVNDYLGGKIPAGDAPATKPTDYAYSDTNYEHRITFNGR